MEAPHGSGAPYVEVPPLKRGNACLQCKKRKTRCDGLRPVCDHCKRSHAHALRSAARNRTDGPELVCEWVDEDETSMSEPLESGQAQLPGLMSKKRAVKGKNAVVNGVLQREKDRRREEDREVLLARIADLESRLAAIKVDQLVAGEQGGLSNGAPSSRDSSEGTGLNDAAPGVYSFDGLNGPRPGSMDMNGLLIPLEWPSGLPSPFMLDLFVDAFFSHAPLFPRMMQRSSLLSRLRLPPTHVGFPHTALLHAICAFATPYTAWANASTRDADFGLAQAEYAQASVRTAMQVAVLVPDHGLVEICQACLILSDLYVQRDMAPQGWMLAGTPLRLLKVLENMDDPRRELNKRPVSQTIKDAVEREERYATIWLTVLMDAGFALNSYWNSSVDLANVSCPLPVERDVFTRMDCYYAENLQTAQSTDLFTHGLHDPFILTVKAAILLSRAADWLRRYMRDKGKGMDANFAKLIDDIYLFQSNIPNTMRNLDSGVDASSILVHILPNIAICLLFEPFADWHSPQPSHPLNQIQQGFEGVLGILHLIPSNLDISVVTACIMVFALYSCGRLIANSILRDTMLHQYGLAMRHRADLQTVQTYLRRHGQKYPLGTTMSRYLDNYLQALNQGRFQERGQLSATSHVLTDEKTKQSPRTSPASSSHASGTSVPLWQNAHHANSYKSGPNTDNEHQEWFLPPDPPPQPRPLRQAHSGSQDPSFPSGFTNGLGRLDAAPTASDWFAAWDHFNSLDTSFLPSATSLAPRSQEPSSAGRPDFASGIHQSVIEGDVATGDVPSAYINGVMGSTSVTSVEHADIQGLPPGMPYDASQGNWTW